MRFGVEREDFSVRWIFLAAPFVPPEISISNYFKVLQEPLDVFGMVTAQYTYLHGNHVSGILSSSGRNDPILRRLCHRRPLSRAPIIPDTKIPAALRKLDMINAAREITDLRVPPGNHLEALKGSRDGFYSIRINDQWRIIFRWEDRGARDVRVVDYH
jgi:proteic killer suppression protein